jgi:hypothetical protein
VVPWAWAVHKVYIIFHTTYMSREIAVDGSQIAQRAEAKITGFRSYRMQSKFDIDNMKTEQRRLLQYSSSITCDNIS